MLRWFIFSVLNLLTALRFGVRWVVRRLFPQKEPLAVWVRIQGELPYLAEPRRVPVLARWLKRPGALKDQEPHSVRELSRDLAALAKEPFVRALVVHLENFEGGGATLSALLKAVQPFKDANKP